MNEKSPHKPVVVGIDGSETAIRAAQWAIDEAISRSVPLRLIYVTRAVHESSDEYTEEVRHAKAALQAAQEAIESTGQPVKVETEILMGPPGPALIEQSRSADLICVGSIGIGRYARSILGSTATDLAEKAQCPVMIVRVHDEEPTRDISWIVVAKNAAPDNEIVIEQAMREALLRRTPVLLLGGATSGETTQSELDQEVAKWKLRYSNVHVYPVANRADVGHFMRKHHEPVRLAVIDGSDADELATIVGPYGQSVFHHAESSVLVVRH